MVKADLTADEIRLVATLAKIEKHPHNIIFDALYLKVSETKKNERAQTVKNISAMIAPVLKISGGAKFFLLNGDIVVIYPRQLKILLERVIFKITFFVSETAPEDFATFYDLKENLPEFFDYIKKQVSKVLKKEGDEEVYVDADEPPDFSEYYSDDLAIDLYTSNDMIPTELKKTAEEIQKEEDRSILTPLMLAELDNVTHNMDFHPFVKMNPVLRINQQGKEQVMEEVAINVADFRGDLLPEIDLTKAPWLFFCITQHFDREVLKMMQLGNLAIPKQDIILNLNITSLLSSDFLPFDNLFSYEEKSKITISLMIEDIFSNMPAFTIAQSFLKTCGYKLCIAGLYYSVLPFTNITRFQPDFIRLRWSPVLATLSQQSDNELHRNLDKIGKHKIILEDVNSASIFYVGKELGIELLKGDYITHNIGNPSAFI